LVSFFSLRPSKWKKNFRQHIVFRRAFGHNMGVERNVWTFRRDVSGMIPLLTFSLLLVAPVPESNSEVLVLFAEDAAYRASSALEARYEGRLTFLPAQAGVPGRFRLLVTEGDGQVHPYDLRMPRPVLELSPHVGQMVRIVGKNTEQGLWPGRLERLRQTGGLGPDGVIARSPWQPAAARRIQRQVQTHVIRSADQAASLMLLNGPASGETAGRLLARELGRPEIDWNRQMVVCVAAGLKTDVERLTIRRTVVKGQTLTVYYELTGFAGGKSQGFGYPAETVLVPRFDGTIRFAQVTGP
jgi:hypothetical protein